MKMVKKQLSLMQVEIMRLALVMRMKMIMTKITLENTMVCKVSAYKLVQGIAAMFMTRRKFLLRWMGH